MNIFKFFTKKQNKKQNYNFDEFFLHASEKEKQRIFTNVAKQANEDQKLLVEHLNSFEHKAT